MTDTKQILVVDDHYEMLELLRSMLKLSDQEYKVVTVPTAEEGMLEYRRENFDLLITDVRLPGMNGFDLVRRVKKSNNELPVIIITAYSSTEGQAEAEKLGVSHYISKPLDTDGMLLAVQNVLQKEDVNSKTTSKIVDTPFFRLDTALPGQVQQNRSFELAVAIRLPNSPKLQEDGLDKTKSGELQVEWPVNINSAWLRVTVSAPECKLHSESNSTFRLYRGQEPPVFYFQLTPEKTGRIGILVTVYQELEWLGGTRIHTEAKEQVAGKVETTVYSRPITISNESQAAVAKHIADLFIPSEFRQLCFESKVPYTELPGETHSEKARELVTHIVRRGRFGELIAECQKHRSFIDWEALADIVVVE